VTGGTLPEAALPLSKAAHAVARASDRIFTAIDLHRQAVTAHTVAANIRGDFNDAEMNESKRANSERSRSRSTTLGSPNRSWRLEPASACGPDVQAETNLMTFVYTSGQNLSSGCVLISYHSPTLGLHL
jgi:hypothetical protein